MGAAWQALISTEKDTHRKIVSEVLCVIEATILTNNEIIFKKNYKILIPVHYKPKFQYAKQE
jgi:hypothetical protein